MKKKNNMKERKSDALQVISSHTSRVNYEDVQRQHDKVVEQQGVSHGEMFKLLRNNKCDVAGGIIDLYLLELLLL